MLRTVVLVAMPLVAAAQPRANIFMLLTDDQDVTLGGLDGQAHGIPHTDGPNPMPKLQKLLTEKGTTFSNAFVHTPICCPSRSSYMVGI
jgi:arylsulfatase A-like enzyme